MQHLYHEQTNTISSTSTSSSSSKHSQSKSNDTSTTTTAALAATAASSANVNLLQLCSPPHPSHAAHTYMARSNAAATALCFRNPHAGVSSHGDTMDYHVYETIPSDGTTYTVCTGHSAFKPVVQSNSHTIRPFLPRTNILYHPPGSSKQFYDSTSTQATTSTVLMPVCCHHRHAAQCSTGTLRQHISPRLIPPPPPIASQEQIYVGSESIV